MYWEQVFKATTDKMEQLKYSLQICQVKIKFYWNQQNVTVLKQWSYDNF